MKTEIAFVLFAMIAGWFIYTTAIIAEDDYTDTGVGCTLDCLEPE